MLLHKKMGREARESHGPFVVFIKLLLFLKMAVEVFPRKKQSPSEAIAGERGLPNSGSRIETCRRTYSSRPESTGRLLHTHTSPFPLRLPREP